MAPMSDSDGSLLVHIPHSRALGLRVVETGDGHALFRVPWNERLIGNPATGVLHGGVVTSALDSASGAAVHSALASRSGSGRSIATLDLRIDYMKPATPGRDVLAAAHCYKLTTNIAFVRGVAYHDDPEDPIATTVAAFMLGSPDRRREAEASP